MICIVTIAIMRLVTMAWQQSFPPAIPPRLFAPAPTQAVIPTTLQAQPARPNILLVPSGDHSVAYVGVYGNPDIKTPNLDAFAEVGCASSGPTPPRRSRCNAGKRPS
jgi:hypothetical protein